MWWLVLLALQLVKLVHVLLLSGWRPHSPVSVHTLDATAAHRTNLLSETSLA